MFRGCKKGVTKVEGNVVLWKASLLDLKDLSATLGDRLFELMQQQVSFQLVSSHQLDPGEISNIHEYECC